MRFAGFLLLNSMMKGWLYPVILKHSEYLDFSHIQYQRNTVGPGISVEGLADIIIDRSQTSCSLFDMPPERLRLCA